jgi:uncharacterized protein (TIGR02217 family)
MFLEDQLDTDNSFGSDFSEAFAVDVTNTMIYRHTSLKHPYGTYSFNIVFNNKTLDEQLEKVIDFYQRCGGQYGGFRFKHRADFSTNDYTGVPTAGDQLCVEIDSTHYQRRKILKPVTGTVLVSSRVGAVYTTLTLTTDYTIDYTTGIITLVSGLSSNEDLYAGCYFDIPVAFNTDLSGVSFTTKTASNEFILSAGIDLIEIRNPG